MRVFFNGDANSYMDVTDADANSHWLKTGWTAQPVDPNAPPPPTPSSAPEGTTLVPDENQRRFLVSFTGDPTPDDNSTGQSLPWLYDRKENSYRPFKTIEDFNAFAVANRQDPQTLLARVTTLSPDDALDRWKGSFLSHQYSPSVANGTITYPPYRGGNSAGLAVKDRYGMVRNADAENLTAKTISEILLPSWQSKGVISADSVSAINDPATLAKYVSAMLYGGYFPEDIYRDIKLKELAKSDPRYANMSGVDEEMNRKEFADTDEFAAMQQDSRLMVPLAAFSGQEYLIGNYPVYNIPDQFYADTRSNIDWNDPKFREEADKIAAGFFEVANASMTALGQQAKDVANDNYSQFIDSVNRNYGLSLSKDAETAWGQVEKLGQTMNDRGLAGTGFEDEARQNYIRDVQKGMEVMRQEKGEKLDAQTENWLRTSASPEQIQEFTRKMDREDAKKGIAEDQYRSNRWGLKPSSETMSFFSLDNLKKKYPTYSDEQIRLLRDSVMDENGMYRSSLYRSQAEGRLRNLLDQENYQRTTHLNDTQQAIDREFEWTQRDALSSFVPENDPTNQNTSQTPPADQSVNRSVPAGWHIGPNGNFEKDTPGTAPAQASPSVTPPPGYTRIPGPSGLASVPVADRWQAPGSPDIYQRGPTTPPAGYTRIPGPSGLASVPQADRWQAPGSPDIYQRPAAPVTPPAPAASTAAANISSSLSGNTAGTNPAPRTNTATSTTPNVPAPIDTSFVDITNRFGDSNRVMRSDYENYWRTQGAGSWTLK